ncbi:MAG: hypothetical protein CL954_10155, partial [Erythrobacteraceae bacterium]|nr:hypothetical protein [Erythrobacteraceae bacterium]
AIGRVGASPGAVRGARALRKVSIRSTSARMPSDLSGFCPAGGGTGSTGSTGSASSGATGGPSGSTGLVGSAASVGGGAGSGACAVRSVKGAGPCMPAPVSAGPSASAGSAPGSFAATVFGIGSARSDTPSRSSTRTAADGRSRRCRRKPRVRIGSVGMIPAHSSPVRSARCKAAAAIAGCASPNQRTSSGLRNRQPFSPTIAARSPVGIMSANAISRR